MKRSIHTIFFFIGIIMLVVSCNRTSESLLSATLEDAFIQARNQNKKLLVVAYMPGCSSCEKFSDTLKKIKLRRAELLSKYLIYECNLGYSANEHISQISYSVASPTTYLFNEKGILENVILGNINSDQFIKQVTDKNSFTKNFRIGLETKEYIQFVNTILKSYYIYANPRASNQQLKNALHGVENSFATKNYFFNNYLAAKLSQKLNYPTLAKRYAALGLTYEDDFSIFLYQKLRSELKTILSDDYNQNNESKISFKRTEVDIGSLAINSSSKINFEFRNLGKSPLKIKNVLASCDCMDVKWPSNLILPGQSGEIDVIYHANSYGSFNKVLWVTTNSKNEQKKLIITGLIN